MGGHPRREFAAQGPPASVAKDGWVGARHSRVRWRKGSYDSPMSTDRARLLDICDAPFFCRSLGLAWPLAVSVRTKHLHSRIKKSRQRLYLLPQIADRITGAPSWYLLFRFASTTILQCKCSSRRLLERLLRSRSRAAIPLICLLYTSDAADE